MPLEAPSVVSKALEGLEGSQVSSMIKILHKCTIKNGRIIPSDIKRFKQDLNEFEGKEVSIIVSEWVKTRSLKQNNSLWLYFTLLAEALNGIGFDMRTLIKKEVEIEWTKDSVCQYLWRPLQKTMFQKKSTTQITTKDINDIYDNLNRIIIERTKGEVQVDFPCLEGIFNNNENTTKRIRIDK